MKEYTYHKDVRRLITSVGKMLDGIVIRRYADEGGGEVVDDIAVPVKYAPKSRVLHALTNFSNHIQLPILSYQLKNISYDEKRSFNKIPGFTLPSKFDKTGRIYPQPSPVNLSFSTSFLCRFEGDADQFISCLYSHFYPYAVVSYEFPEIGTEVRSKFIWQGTANLAYPDDLDSTKAYRCEVTSEFTLEGWLFKNIPDVPHGIIYNIPMSFQAVSELEDAREMNEIRRYTIDAAEDVFLPSAAKFETPMEAPNTDFLTLSGRCCPRSCSHSVIKANDDMRVVQLKGSLFETVSAVVASDVSGHPFSDDDYHTFNFYSADKSLSGFGTVSGVSVPYEVLSDNEMLVQIPPVETSGVIDINLLGKYGIGTLRADSKREYIKYNEHSVSLPKYTEGIWLETSANQ